MIIYLKHISPFANSEKRDEFEFSLQKQKTAQKQADYYLIYDGILKADKRRMLKQEIVLYSTDFIGILYTHTERHYCVRV